jgi:hypothetical protein
MYEYNLIRSKRRTVSLSIDEKCRIVVRAPLKMPQKDIDDMVERHTHWIDKHMPAAQKRMEKSNEITPELLAELTERAKLEIPPRVEHFAQLMELKPTGIRITTARKRFGICSSRKSLCFSCLLMMYPPEVIDCVVVHELAHIKHHNHSADFYNYIYKYMPDYREREKLLRAR